MGLDLAQFHQAFFEECAESLDHMEQALLALDPSNDHAEVINAIFRGAHSIKGGAATFGFQEVAGFTHAMETLLDRVRDGSKRIAPEDIELLLASVDCVRGMLSALQRAEPVDTARGTELGQRLEAALRRDGAAAPVSAPAVSAPPIAAGNAKGDDEITEAEFDALLDTLHGTGGAPGVKTGSDEITEAEFDALLDSLHGKGQAPGAPRAATDEITDTEFERLLDALHGTGQAPGGEGPRWRIAFRPHSGMLRNGNDPIRIFKELEALGTLRVHLDAPSLPDFRALDPETCHLAWTLDFAGCDARDPIAEAFAWVEGECELTIEDRRPTSASGGESKARTGEPGPRTETAAPGTPSTERGRELGPAPAAPAPPPAAPAPATVAAPRPAATGEAASIRVAIDKIDALINMVGELVITQSMLNELSENFDMSRLPRLLDGLAQLGRNTRELQESVMRVRMIPISFAFNRFPRLVHDLSAKLGKRVELKMTGEQTELDKTVMEKIGDPLVHLVRNALDHGIEAPEVRARRGKPETGTLCLNAYHQSGHIVIEIADDGGGLSKERILRKARERGLVKDDALLPDDKIHDLIFLPGFSTADTVSDVSGRGVGMDVVRKNIKALGGQIEIRSEEGRGTTMTIRLPLTLAILDGQTVRVGEQTYIVPLVSIVESIQAQAGMINVVAGKAEVIRLREEYVPIVRLYEVFHVQPRVTRIEEGLLVVVEGEGLKAGLFVDELLGQQQAVIKSLEANFRHVEGVAGATILGDGTVSLILDVPGLIRLAQGRGLLARPPASPATASLAA